MLLQNKIAVIYGAGGSVPGAIARAIAEAGAKVFLTGNKLAPVQQLADELTAAGLQAEAAQVDAMDKSEVDYHLAKVIEKAGKADISFNAIALKDVQGKALWETSPDDFIRPINRAMQSHFITATAAVRAMQKHGSGVILSLTATPGGIGYPYSAGFGVACIAMEGFYANLAAEAGAYGIRAVNMRSGGSPDSQVFKDATAKRPEVMKIVMENMENDTMLKRMPLMADIAHTAVFLVSDLATAITGTTVDLTCGTTAGLNYRVGKQFEESRFVGS